MVTSRVKRGNATLRPRARLIRLIGDELISDEPVALVELVKNSYDADATKVQVRFEGRKTGHPERIIVVDDGVGMDLHTVLTAWLEPGTTAKRTRKTSIGGRPLQGAKGIGRFASARLAESLLLESKPKDDDHGVYLLLDWGLFDDDSYLDDVDVEYETRTIDDSSHWTRLTLETLRQSWDEADYIELHARLSRLVSPFNDVDDFSIELDIPGYPQLSGIVQPPELILHPKYRLQGTLDDQGSFTGQILVDDQLVRELEKQKLGDANAIPSCGPFEVEVRAWDRDPKSLDPLGSALSMGSHEIRRTLNMFCGVSIYRDGFRVYPYGQKGNDWLGLDNRSRQNPAQHLANNQIVGAIRITRTGNPHLEDRSTREGMILNSEHASLEEWFKEVLALLERERYEHRPRHEKPEYATPLFEAFDVSGAAKRARRELGADHPIAHLITETEKQIKTGVDQLQEVFSRLLMSAGLGHMVDIVIHEIGSPLGKINRQLILVERALSQLADEAARASLLNMVSSIKGWLEQIHTLRQRLEPQTPAKRGRATSFNVYDEIADNLQLYDALIKKQGIQASLVQPRQPIRVKMSRAALGQIIVNLLDNSIYWIIRSKGAGKGGTINIRIRRLPHGFSALLCDDGPGVNEEDQPHIFDPYFTRKPNGIGLGLYIARLVIEPYGKLVYRNGTKPLVGACFEAKFEQRVGL